MRIVLDANVYIAAFLGTGLASDILELGSINKLDLYTSADILLEVQGKLTEKFQIEGQDLREFLRLVGISTTLVTPQRKLKVVQRDPSDNKILECAVEADANLIVTMDRDLLKLESFKKIGIVHPKTLTWIIPKIFEKD